MRRLANFTYAVIGRTVELFLDVWEAGRDGVCYWLVDMASLLRALAEWGDEDA
jgi:hypothetical protein